MYCCGLSFGPQTKARSPTWRFLRRTLPPYFLNTLNAVLISSNSWRMSTRNWVLRTQHNLSWLEAVIQNSCRFRWTSRLWVLWGVCPVKYVVESTYSNGKYYININNRQINSLEPQWEKYVIKATAVESIHSARDARREGRKLVACFLPEFRTSLR